MAGAAARATGLFGLGLDLAPAGLGTAWAQAGPAAGAAPTIVASFSLLADLVRAVAPAAVRVEALVGPDADAHVFNPSPAHSRRLAQADLVVVNGLGFEGWIERLVRASGYRGPQVVASAGIQPRAGGEHGRDPHIWQDVALTRRCVATLAQAIARRWPEQADETRRRAQAYDGELQALDARIREALAPVPRPQRRVITTHDAFGYFGAAYGVDFLSAQGWSTHAEPSAAAVARLIRQIRSSGARAVFLENISDPRLAQRIAQEGGVGIGGTLYSDALSSPGGPADSYLKLMDHNAQTLVRAMAAAPR